MAAASRDQLNATERLELDGYLSRQVQKRSRAKRGSNNARSDHSQSSSTGRRNSLSPLLHDDKSDTMLPDETDSGGNNGTLETPRVATVTNASLDTPLPSSGGSARSSPNRHSSADVTLVAVEGSDVDERDTPGGGSNRVGRGATAAGARHSRGLRDEEGTRSSGSEERRERNAWDTPPPLALRRRESVADEKDMASEAEEKIRQKASGRGMSPFALADAGFQQTLHVTNQSGGKSPGQSLQIHHPFGPATSPLIVRKSGQGPSADQGGHLHLEIGANSMEAQLHNVRPDGAGGRLPREDEMLGHGDRPIGGDNQMQILEIDSYTILLFSTASIWLWLAWQMLSAWS